jgi:hypothetical protein
MEKNKLLNIAVVICKSIRILYIFLFIGLTAFFIHFQVSPNAYKGIAINRGTSSNFQISKSISWKSPNTATNKEAFSLNKISKSVLCINYLKLSTILIFIFLATREFQKVIQSVKDLKTFQKNNAQSFRKIGAYIFIIFLITSFVNIGFQEGNRIEISIAFSSLFLMLIAFILAEVFKEGNLLQREKDLTI